MSRNVTLVLFLRTGKSLCTFIEIDLEFHYLTQKVWSYKVNASHVHSASCETNIVTPGIYTLQHTEPWLGSHSLELPHADQPDSTDLCLRAYK